MTAKKKTIEKTVEPKVIKPIVIETIKAEKQTVKPAFEKVNYLYDIPLPPDHVRCIVLVDFNGMTDELRAGDIVDLPERRYKSLSFRGMVKKYDGKELPNRSR